jgi:hypothetical protein
MRLKLSPFVTFVSQPQYKYSSTVEYPPQRHLFWLAGQQTRAETFLSLCLKVFEANPIIHS